ncbi:MAG: TIM barrel protein [Armatimonadetes bacterium]|nr:TIM barrel protein [Armatimonadota bacterium]
MIEACIFADEVSQEFDQAVRLSVAAGARCIELRGGIWGRAVQNCTDEDVARMQHVLAEEGARVAVLGSPVGKCHLGNEEEHATHLRWFDRMCELAHAFETRVIRGFAFWNPTQEDRIRPNLEEYLPRIAERLGPIVAKAERENLLYCFETEGSTMTGTCGEIATVIEALGGSPSLGAAWDVNNGWGCGELPYPDGYAAIRGRVRHLHVKPNAQKNLETVADTSLSYAEILRVLKADGYAGCASIEHWGSPELMLEGVRQLAPLLTHLA